MGRIIDEIVNLDLEGALEAVLEEMRLDGTSDYVVWEEVSCLDLDDPFPMLDPVWVDSFATS